MSMATVTHPSYETREGLSSFGEGREHPYIEGLVDGRGVAIAFETPPDDDGQSLWLLVSYSSADKEPARVIDAHAARTWLEYTTKSIAEAIAGQSISGGAR